MKKGIEWLNLMTRKEQVMFLKNLITYPSADPADAFRKNEDYTIDNYLNRSFQCFDDFISFSFVWEETPEGHDWWSQFSKSK